MALLKKLVVNKYIWIGCLTLFLINTAVNANKESHSDLLDEYYGDMPLDTVKQISNVYIPTKADSLTNFATTLLGKGYTYGKSGPETFDCSGFIYYVFKKFNISIPRSSRIQAKHGKLLELEQVEKGDLLFFKSPSPDNPNIGHVGIVIKNDNGNIQFIHSSTGRGVVIDDLEESRHYSKRFIEARRYL